jgi:ABC-type Fe3+ transport system permease subunit
VPALLNERIIGVTDPEDDTLVIWGVIREGEAPKQLVAGGEFFVLKKVERVEKVRQILLCCLLCACCVACYAAFVLPVVLLIVSCQGSLAHWHPSSWQRVSFFVLK